MGGDSNASVATLLAWIVIALATVLLSGPQIERLGLYYDEAFIAQQGRDFVEPEHAAIHPPSVTTAVVAGRPFPIRNAAYLGSLKSQLAIPSFALFGASKSTLRYATLAVGLLGLLFAMLAVRHLFGAGVAIVSGLLVATDPAFHFFAQFEWGPFTSLFLCRGLGVYLLIVAAKSRSPGANSAAWVGSAICFGLGVYSRVDFGVILVGFAVATLLAARPWLGRVLREQRTQLVFAAIAFALAVSPVLVVLAEVFGAGAGISDRGDLGYRVQVLVSAFDGSHWARLLDVGGLFDEMFANDARTSVFPAVLAASCLGALVLAARNEDESRASIAWLFVALLATAAMMLAIPGAVRAHHMLNLSPLPQIVVAVAAVLGWRAAYRSESTRAMSRVGIAITMTLCLASNLAVAWETARTMRDTEGTGRFSRSLEDFAATLDASPTASTTEVVALDWGFYEPVHFSTRHITSREPIWKIGEAMTRGGAWQSEGDAKTIYLFHEGAYDLFGLGDPFARLLRIHEARVATQEHRDGRGEVAFKSARFDAPHTLSFAGRSGEAGGFRLRWRPAEPPPPVPAAQP
jgi:hypothetical protein